nr:VCBS repeat-containing protein [Chthoniobacterales bacterium]
APDANTGAEAVSIAVADFNGDGFADFVVDSFIGNAAALHVFLGKGNGTFASPTTVAAGSAPVSVVAGDLNDDGKADLISLNGNPRNTLSVYLNTTAFPAAGNLVNISTRLRVATGENVLISGFIIQGSESKRLIVRAIGPDLGVPDSLQDPTVALVNAQGTILASNDNWRSTQQAAIIATGIPPKDDRDAALIATVAPGAYTAVVRGANGTTGVGLVEAYDLATGGNSHFVNISTRGFVSTDANVMIGGFIVPNGPPVKVVVRGLGPSLANAGVSGALQDPTLELRRSTGELVYANDNWRTTQPSELYSTRLAPIGERESAVFVKLLPGAYTAILRGKNATSGLGLLEVYRLP